MVIINQINNLLVCFYFWLVVHITQALVEKVQEIKLLNFKVRRGRLIFSTQVLALEKGQEVKIKNLKFKM